MSCRLGRPARRVRERAARRGKSRLVDQPCTGCPRPSMRLNAQLDRMIRCEHNGFPKLRARVRSRRPLISAGPRWSGIPGPGLLSVKLWRVGRARRRAGSGSLDHVAQRLGQGAIAGVQVPYARPRSGVDGVRNPDARRPRDEPLWSAATTASASWNSRAVLPPKVQWPDCRPDTACMQIACRMLCDSAGP